MVHTLLAWSQRPADVEKRFESCPDMPLTQRSIAQGLNNYGGQGSGLIFPGSRSQNARIARTIRLQSRQKRK
jgi:hypothetical protein